LTVQFTDKSTGAPIEWKWDFGDGANSTESNPTHTYSLAGNYTVNLTVNNSNGASSKLSTINVSVNSSLPIFPGCTKPPLDPNNDGLSEDINGNSRLDFSDVVTYYNNIWHG
jgi:PKD repeat protein